MTIGLAVEQSDAELVTGCRHGDPVGWNALVERFTRYVSAIATQAFRLSDHRELLRLLPPAPAGWATAAQELPLARVRLDSLVERAEADAAFRASVVADLEVAIRAAGVEPSPVVVEHLRKRLAR